MSDFSKLNGYNVKDAQARNVIATLSETLNELNQPVNILTLGAKNDGSEDVSVIINEYTGEHPLFFPSGIYRIDNTIHLVNSIFGVGYRRYTNDDNATVFKSTLTEGCVIELAGTGHVTVKGISITLNGDETGILQDTNRNLRSFINEVNISNVGNNSAIKIAPTIFVSRATFIDNVTIIGSRNYDDSTGIELTSNAGDSRITNTEVMGTKTGMSLGGVQYIDNVHVWCGCLPQVDQNEWWSGTKALILDNCVLSGGNVYLDSALLMITCRNNSVFKIANLILWMDNSMTGSSRYDASTFYFVSQPSSRASAISNLVAYCSDRLKYVTNTEVLIDHPTVFTDADLNDDHINQYFTTKNTTLRNYLLNRSSTGTKYIEIAALYYRGWGGACKLIVESDNNSLDELLITANAKEVKHIFGSANYYYKRTGNIMKIYKETSGNLNTGVTVITGGTNINPFIYKTTYNLDRSEKALEVLDDTTGLTQFTVQ